MIRCLILILTPWMTLSLAQAQSIYCGTASSSLTESARAMMALANAGAAAQIINSGAYRPSAVRAPANSYADNNSNDSSEGTTDGLGAIESWFNRNATKSRGLCTKGVRMALQAGGWWPCGQGMGMSPQYEAGPNLLRNGFKKISLSDPSQAKPGTVLIYKSVCSPSVDKNARYGHIEMRTRTGYASDFIKNVPISTYNKCRKFKEAYVKVGPPGKACYQTMGRRR